MESDIDTHPEVQQGASFRDLIAIVRRGIILAFVVGGAAAGLAFFLSNRLVPKYEATATLLSSQPDRSQDSFGVSLVTAPAVAVSAYQAAATSQPVLQSALIRLGTMAVAPDDIEAIRKQLSVAAELDDPSSLIHVNVADANAALAADKANAVAEALLDWDKQRATQNLENVIRTLEGRISAVTAEIARAQEAAQPDKAQIDSLNNMKADQNLQLDSAKALRSSAVGHLEILEPASTPREPVSPKPARNAVLAFAVGVILVYGALILRIALDTRFRSSDDIARQTQLPLMAEFPRVSGGPGTLPREAANYLRTNLTFALADSHPKIVLVTSAMPGEGKTSVSMSVAESFARNDYRTLLIDGDLRSPTIVRAYQLSGLMSATFPRYLEDPEADVEPITIETNAGRLDFLPTLRPVRSPSELLSQGLGRVLARFARSYDVIVLDSPPVLPVADALAMAAHASGVVVTVSLPTAERRTVKAAVGLLERIGARPLGVVATKLERTARRRQEHAYGYGYGYGTPAGDKGKKRAAHARVAPGTAEEAARPVATVRPHRASRRSDA